MQSVQVMNQHGPFAPGFRGFVRVTHFIYKWARHTCIRSVVVARSPSEHADPFCLVSSLVPHSVKFRDGPGVAEQHGRYVFGTILAEKSRRDFLVAELVRR